MRGFLFILAALVLIGFVQPARADLDDYDGLLADHVKSVTSGQVTYNGVDYDSWSQDDRHKKGLKDILSTNPDDLKSECEKLAFWINAYNFLTIDLIVSEGERESIKNLGALFTSPWKKYTWSISGQSYTLDYIEHEILRKMGEPRIHFAINCAAKSCPDLRMESYRADKIDDQLADQVRQTFDNVTKGFVAFDGKNTVRVSKVMDWFSEDFDNGNVRAWLMRYRPEVINDSTQVKFFDYDWSLNRQ